MLGLGLGPDTRNPKFMDPDLLQDFFFFLCVCVCARVSFLGGEGFRVWGDKG